MAMAIYVNEYALELDRHNLWVGAEDNDSHCPLMVRLKPTGWQSVRNNSFGHFVKVKERRDNNLKRQDNAKRPSE